VPPGVLQDPSCPWDGSGWQFSCVLCRKAFTFAVGVELAGNTLDMICALDRFRWSEHHLETAPCQGTCAHAAQFDQRRRNWLPWFEGQRLVVGQEYVYLDGMLFPVPAEGSARIDARGTQGLHRGELPQVLYRRDPGAMETALAQPYWQRAQALAARAA
jgi:hypothetical protein